MCTPTGSPGDWGVPKGGPDAFESYDKTAMRELREETGIDITKYSHKVISLGQQMYPIKSKLIIGYAFLTDVRITQDLYCDSYFVNRRTMKREKEISSYWWFDLSASLSFMRIEQRRLINYIANQRYENYRQA